MTRARIDIAYQLPSGSRRFCGHRGIENVGLDRLRQPTADEVDQVSVVDDREQVGGRVFAFGLDAFGEARSR